MARTRGAGLYHLSRNGVEGGEEYVMAAECSMLLNSSGEVDGGER